MSDECAMANHYDFEYGGERFSVYVVEPVDGTSSFINWTHEGRRDFDRPEEEFLAAFAAELLRVVAERSEALEGERVAICQRDKAETHRDALGRALLATMPIAYGEGWEAMAKPGAF